MRKIFAGFSIIWLVLIGCQQEVTFENSGAPSVGTLNKDANGDCLPITVSGLYIAGTGLNGATNYIRLEIDIATAGSYTIYTDTVNGYYFRATGAFSSTGTKQVTLKGFGTPGAAGVNDFVVHYGSQTCAAEVTVFPAGTGNATFTINCSGATVNGTYTAGTILTSSNTVVLPVTVTNAGTYSINTTAVNGITFSGSGGLTASSTSITLTASGTPGTSGSSAINVSSGSGTCSFNVTVNPSGGGGGSFNWKFNQGTTIYQGTTTNATLTSLFGFTTFNYNGSNSDETLIFSLVDMAGGIGNESYNTSSSTGNSGAFIFNFTGGDIWTADPTISGTSVVFNVTSHNTSTKTITGNFAGTVKNSAGASLPITMGTFTATYQ